MKCLFAADHSVLLVVTGVELQNGVLNICEDGLT
jgi:hypothetical protein